MGLAVRAGLQAAWPDPPSNARAPPRRSAHSLGPKDRGCAFLRGSRDRNCNRLGYPSDVRDCHQRAHAGAAEPPGRTLSRAPWPLIETANFIASEFGACCNLKMHKFTKNASLACVTPSFHRTSFNMTAFHAAVAPHLWDRPQLGESADANHGGTAIRTPDSPPARPSLSVCNHLPRVNWLR